MMLTAQLQNVNTYWKWWPRCLDAIGIINWLVVVL